MRQRSLAPSALVSFTATSPSPSLISFAATPRPLSSRRSSAGVKGWAEDEELRRALGADGAFAIDGHVHKDRVLGWFHVGVTDKSLDAFQARRGAISSKVTWI